jgi:endonuclease/exonuclease/phosphatase (EEP) superfamily protein YafD
MQRYCSPLLALVLLAPLQNAVWAEEPTAHFEFEVSAPCPAITGDYAQVSSSPGLNPESFTVSSWNIQKSNNTGWQQELEQLASPSDLVLLQEARLQADLSPLQIGHSFATFAPGYATSTQDTGVMTLSTVTANQHCALTHMEPWLQTPKATSIGYYNIDQNTATLLVVNLHGVNFSFSASSLGEQLADVAALIELHEGPVVFGGDFNTWSQPRRNTLLASMAKLGLETVPFAEDHRITTFGYPLDHILIRGLAVVNSQSYTVNSSDHNPISVTLTLLPLSEPAETASL